MSQKLFELEAKSSQLPTFREEMRKLLAATGLDEKKTGETILAVDEALTNVIRHAYGGKSGKIEINFEDLNDRIRIMIRDYGKTFDPTQAPEPELPPTKPGGLGIYFIKKLTDEVSYDSCSGTGNKLILTKLKS